jgi:ABC-type transporter Mla MlaB component
MAELLSFNRSTLICCFVFNISAYVDDREMIDCFVRVFFDIIQHFDSSGLAMLVELLIEEVYATREYSVEEGSLFIRMAKKCIE